MTDHPSSPPRRLSLLARGEQFTTGDLQTMQRDFHQARAASDGASDGDLIRRILRAFLAAREAA